MGDRWRPRPPHPVDQLLQGYPGLHLAHGVPLPGQRGRPRLLRQATLPLPCLPLMAVVKEPRERGK